MKKTKTKPKKPAATPEARMEEHRRERKEGMIKEIADATPEMFVMLDGMHESHEDVTSGPAFQLRRDGAKLVVLIHHSVDITEAVKLLRQQFIPLLREEGIAMMEQARAEVPTLAHYQVDQTEKPF